MRHKLTNLASIPDVIADMTLDEKLNLVGAYKACHTLEIPDMNISALNLTDGATGVNGVQVILDYITAPENKTIRNCAGDFSSTCQNFQIWSNQI